MMNRFLFTIIIIVSVAAGVCAEAKHADLAGSWYTASPDQLRSELEKYLRDARVGKIGGDILGVIAPHAGFRFSGPVAAYAYKAVMEKNPSKVIVVGFTHRRYFPDRIAVLTDEAFVTPLGRALIDTDIANKLIAYDRNIQYIPQAFDAENSIEMEVPFIQVALKDARLVIVALCDQRLENCRLLADALYSVLQNEKDFVLVASTDMCHYLSYDVTNKRDAETIAAIKTLDPDSFYFGSLKERHELMCGYGAVYAVMSVCKRLGADKVEVLKYANSGDTSGMKDRVVGYLSAAFIKSGKEKEAAIAEGTARKVFRGIFEKTEKKEEQSMFSQEQKEELLKIARDTIRYYLETGKRLDVEVRDEALKQDMGAFVTLRKHGQLRGCIGHMVATAPLYLTVRDMAISAATEDPRFAPVTLDELDDIEMEISALSPMRKIDDYSKIEMGKHGVMVKSGWRSGVYLPQVADETGWDREQFMSSLCAHKAGISPDAWKTGNCDIYVFTAEVFEEKEAKK
jgi:AmmeMemoRadiSam system protein B/AmmeMemoRadiSam system protein A